MKPLLNLLFTVLIGLLLIPGTAAQQQEISKKGEEIGPVTSTAGSRLTLNPNFGKVPLYFIPNKGQVNEKAKFYAKTSRYTLWMTREGLVFDSVRKVEEKRQKTEDRRLKTDFNLKGAISIITSGIHAPMQSYNHASMQYHSQSPHSPDSPYSPHSTKLDRDVSRLVFLAANKNPGIVPLEITRHKVNYFIGNDPAKWQKGISTSRAVLYKDIYKNIDLKVYGNESQVEYDWIVKPGGNPAHIRFEYKNVKGTRIDKKGDLLIKTNFGKLLHKKPVSYQLMEGYKINIESKFKKIGRNMYGFLVKLYDENYELIIDPVISLEYSTYLGGMEDDIGNAIVVDNKGYIYVTGSTDSTVDFPISDEGYQSYSAGLTDVFVTKFNPEGSSLIYSTYLGGNQDDFGTDIDIFSNGYTYICGATNSTDFPAINSIKGGYDAFVARFDSVGNYIGAYCVGGSSNDFGYALAEDSTSNVFMTGCVDSKDFPLVNPFNNNTTLHHTCGFVCKISPYLSSLKYSTYLGGFFFDYARDIVLDNWNFIYVVGYTGADKYDFPLKNAFQDESNPNKNNVFLCKFNSAGSSLVYSTFLGGLENDYGYKVAVDGTGSAYVAGWTESMDFPTKNALQETNAGNHDAFITKFTPDGTALVYSTYLGGSGPDKIYGFSIDSSGHAFASGFTNSADFPTKNHYQTYSGGNEIFVFMLNTSGSELVFSTLLGNIDSDISQALAVDNSNNIYITGYTNNKNFPTKNPYQMSNHGFYDVFVSRFSFTYELTVQSTPGTGVPITVTPPDCNGSGDGETNFTRNYDPGTLVMLTAPETFNDRIFLWWTIDGNDVCDRSIQVTMNSGHMVTAVYQTWGELLLSRSQLYYGANTSGISSGDQTFFISKGDGGTFNWTINDNASWLSCNPTSGINSGEVTVSVNASGLAAGTYNGTITVSAPNASNSPQYVSVIMLVYKANTIGVPFGYFETPKDGACVYSSIPVTGWALDDIGVEHVRIYRQEGKGLVYIGTAVFVAGARPDVELAYPNYPNCYQAGWGYMMLTNFLPNGGNGTFKIYAIATDKEGHQVTLGTKTIYCDNAHAVKPFGAIDTPSQGGTGIGNNYRNQGWVLTPLPNKIPEDGHTIIVWIDGIDVGKCKYNIYRKDIAVLFPGYANSNGAMAYFDFDTTAYKNGLHTIQWTAVDNAGNVDGIGSRYFSIQNTGGSAASTAQSVESTAAAFNVQSSVFNLNLSPVPPDDSSPVRVKKGYNQNITPHKRFPDANGNFTIEIEELERIEVQLFEGTGGLAPLSNAPLPGFPGPPTNNRMGFLVVGDQLRLLPIGSTFNAQKGIFSWQPGPGFVGTYRFVFIEEKQNSEWSKTFITVNILPKFTGGIYSNKPMTNDQ